MLSAIVSNHLLQGSQRAELPAGITCEAFASEYQPISANGSCARTSVAVAG